MSLFINLAHSKAVYCLITTFPGLFGGPSQTKKLLPQALPRLNHCCKPEKCPELTPDVPRVEEAQESLTNGLIHHLAGENWDRSLYELSWTTTKVSVNLATTNERENQERDLYFHVYVLGVVLARHIPINFYDKNQHCLTKNA